MVLRLTTPHYQWNDKEYTATQKDNTTDKVPDITRFYGRDDEETGSDNEKNPTGKIKLMLHAPPNILYTQYTYIYPRIPLAPNLSIASWSLKTSCIRWFEFTQTTNRLWGTVI